MTVVQKKQLFLINEIKKLQDLELLEYLEQLHSNKEKSYTLSKDELLLVEESREQIETGESKSHKEVIEATKKWLNEE